MTKKFTESIFILIVLNLLVKPFYIFAIDRTIQNRVGAEQYGLYFSLLGFSLLFNIVSDFGITNFNNRNIAQNHDQLSGQIGNLIPLKIILGGIYSIITLFFAFSIGYSNKQFYLLIWLISNQLLVSFILYLRSNISGIQLFITDSIISIIDKLLLIIICSFLLWGSISKSFKIEWFVYAQSISYLISLLISLSIVYKKSDKIKLKLHYKSSIENLKKSFPFAILIFLMVLYTRIDAVMLERMLPDGTTQAGIYAQAFRIFDALSMFAFLFASILLPLLAKMIKEKQAINETLGHSFALLVLPSLGLIVGMLFYSREFMQILYHEHVEESSSVLQFLMIGFIGICASYIFGTLLTASGNLKVLNIIAIFAVLLNIGLNALLIPVYGTRGAAFSSMVTQLLMGVSQGIISIVLFKIKIRPVTLFKYIILVSVLICISVLITISINIWYISFILTPLLAILIGFMLKVLKLKHFSSLFLNKY